MSDIKFNCTRCGQHLTADAAGADINVTYFGYYGSSTEPKQVTFDAQAGKLYRVRARVGKAVNGWAPVWATVPRTWDTWIEEIGSSANSKNSSKPQTSKSEKETP
jgi:hypothetical protein